VILLFSYSLLLSSFSSLSQAFVLVVPPKHTSSLLNGALENENDRLEYSYLDDPNLTNMEKIEIAEKAHSMPWKNPLPSCTDNNDDDDDTEMFYMPFWEWGVQYLKENLTNVKVVECTSKGSRSFGNDHDLDTHTTSASNTVLDYQENEDSRIVSLCFTSNEYRKIRFTYYENSKRQQQSFSSVWYPDYTYNLPILGLNLLSNQQRQTNLAMMDFQPLHSNIDRDHVVPYSHIQKAILQNHPDYTFVSDRIPTLQVFSDHIMCKKFDTYDVVSSHIFPAYCDFVKEHVSLVKSSPQTHELQQHIQERHAKYDTYSAVRDPCTGLLTSSFGKEWADEFVFGFLYSMAEREMQDYWTTTPATSSSSTTTKTITSSSNNTKERVRNR